MDWKWFVPVMVWIVAGLSAAGFFRPMPGDVFREYKGQ
jgi:hypothetical protein